MYCRPQGKPIIIKMSEKAFSLDTRHSFRSTLAKPFWCLKPWALTLTFNFQIQRHAFPKHCPSTVESDKKVDISNLENFYRYQWSQKPPLYVDWWKGIHSNLLCLYRSDVQGGKPKPWSYLIKFYIPVKLCMNIHYNLSNNRFVVYRWIGAILVLFGKKKHAQNV